MDTDGDGIVTAKEMDRPQGHADREQGQHGESDTASASRLGKSRACTMTSPPRRIKMIDTDSDGAITAAEHEAGSKKMFEKMDKDHDGKLSAAEVQAGHDRMMTAEDQ
jgi:Ca2+-binding EF-hand superfamily protein